MKTEDNGFLGPDLNIVPDLMSAATLMTERVSSDGCPVNIFRMRVTEKDAFISVNFIGEVYLNPDRDDSNLFIKSKDGTFYSMTGRMVPQSGRLGCVWVPTLDLPPSMSDGLSQLVQKGYRILSSSPEQPEEVTGRLDSILSWIFPQGYTTGKDVFPGLELSLGHPYDVDPVTDSTRCLGVQVIWVLENRPEGASLLEVVAGSHRGSGKAEVEDFQRDLVGTKAGEIIILVGNLWRRWRTDSAKILCRTFIPK